MVQLKENSQYHISDAGNSYCSAKTDFLLPIFGKVHCYTVFWTGGNRKIVFNYFLCNLLKDASHRFSSAASGVKICLINIITDKVSCLNF